VYFVTHGAQGHAFSYLRAGSAASRMRPADLPKDLIVKASCVHASGISMAISSSAADTVLAAFEAARSNGAKISFDSNLRLKLWPLARARAMTGAAAAMADYFFPSIEDARALSGVEDLAGNIDWSHRLGAKTVFLKLGADGVIVSDGAQREHIPGVRAQSVDATGAGDCFCGAALARLAAGDSIWDAARYANAAAALATTAFGAVDPLPRPDAVRQLLAKN
jgi:2-dehydro-3-deoxygluconokinase